MVGQVVAVLLTAVRVERATKRREGLEMQVALGRTVVIRTSVVAVVAGRWAPVAWVRYSWAATGYRHTSPAARYSMRAAAMAVFGLAPPLLLSQVLMVQPIQDRVAEAQPHL